MACPIGATTAFPGASSLSDCICPANTFFDGPRCSACPAGTTSPGGPVLEQALLINGLGPASENRCVASTVGVSSLPSSVGQAFNASIGLAAAIVVLVLVVALLFAGRYCCSPSANTKPALSPVYGPV
jgi:hypothetical protein